MFKKLNIGKNEMIEPIEIPESKLRLVLEAQAQNRMILEANVELIRTVSCLIGYVEMTGDLNDTDIPE